MKSMINMNIKYFRKNMNMTQEALADKLNVTRQTVAKWENGEVSPNIEDCVHLSNIFDITVDDLLKDFKSEELPFVSPRGKHFFGVVSVGERGQIVIPKKAREIFDIKAGDNLLILGDETQGIAVVKANDYQSFAAHIIKELNKEGDL